MAPEIEEGPGVAGLAMDLAIQSLVMGEAVPGFQPSTKTEDALRVVERMGVLGFWCEIRSPFDPRNGWPLYWATFTPHGCVGSRVGYRGSAQTLPLAVCRAALTAAADQPILANDPEWREGFSGSGSGLVSGNPFGPGGGVPVEFPEGAD